MEVGLARYPRRPGIPRQKTWDFRSNVLVGCTRAVGISERRLPHPLRRRRAPPCLSHPLPRDIRGKRTKAPFVQRETVEPPLPPCRLARPSRGVSHVTARNRRQGGVVVPADIQCCERFGPPFASIIAYLPELKSRVFRQPSVSFSDKIAFIAPSAVPEHFQEAYFIRKNSGFPKQDGVAKSVSTNGSKHPNA